jgi:hypothetical protein
MLRRPKATVSTSNDSSEKGNAKPSAWTNLSTPLSRACSNIGKQKSAAVIRAVGQVFFIANAKSPLPVAKSKTSDG